MVLLPLSILCRQGLCFLGESNVNKMCEKVELLTCRDWKGWDSFLWRKSVEDYTDGLLGQWRQLVSCCSPDAAVWVTWWNQKRIGLKQILSASLHNSWSNVWFLLPQGECRVGWCQQQTGSNRFIGNRSTNGSWGEIPYTTHNMAALDIGR